MVLDRTQYTICFIWRMSTWYINFVYWEVNFVEHVLLTYKVFFPIYSVLQVSKPLAHIAVDRIIKLHTRNVYKTKLYLLMLNYSQYHDVAQNSDRVLWGKPECPKKTYVQLGDHQPN